MTSRLGHPQSEETRRKIAASLTGRKRPQEVRRNISTGQSGGLATLEDRFWAGVGMGPRAPHMETCCWFSMHSEHGNGYMTFSYMNKPRYAHRVSYELNVGPIPDGEQIDHRCHNRRCVRPDHLRSVTSKENHENHTGPQRHNKSGVRGVYWDSGRWRAQLSHRGAKVYVGRFRTIEEAEAAVIAKRNELFTHNELDRV